MVNPASVPLHLPFGLYDWQGALPGFWYFFQTLFFEIFFSSFPLSLFILFSIFPLFPLYPVSLFTQFPYFPYFPLSIFPLFSSFPSFPLFPLSPLSPLTPLSPLSPISLFPLFFSFPLFPLFPLPLLASPSIFYTFITHAPPPQTIMCLTWYVRCASFFNTLRLWHVALSYYFFLLWLYRCSIWGQVQGWIDYFLTIHRIRRIE